MSGSAKTSGSSAPDIEHSCCDNPISSVLTLSVDGCHTGTIQIVYDENGEYGEGWYGSGNLDTEGYTIEFSLYDVTCTWGYVAYIFFDGNPVACAGGGQLGETSSSCSPFEVTFENQSTFSGSTCCDSGFLDYFITE